ncbi:hypothetical protein MKW98_008949 [Papaver atlanticum]|uniref:Uncharacterized protein n=1 Tax=Papaver atlanticum TaxID=357466 RepID=A0AAD4XGH0_9MAGN|nr:hypothetical protein MKW98_008949 [Papaver atlanticum]
MILAASAIKVPFNVAVKKRGGENVISESPLNNFIILNYLFAKVVIRRLTSYIHWFPIAIHRQSRCLPASEERLYQQGNT